MSTSDQPPDVTVVIPAYNAQAMIDETLRSVRAQSHANLEILVVDDGSTDATPDIIARHARQDRRIRLIRQDNAGVAAARNAGAAEARGEFLAPVDADDLWHPRKIERQLALFDEGPADLGLVYTWFALIDEDSNIIHTKHSPAYSGHVLPILAHYNFIGNGSSPLIRLSAFRDSPGYDRTLKARGGQGCEDWKLYCQLADKYRFGVVKAHLTGYRLLDDNMSSDALQMLRSRDLANADIRSAHPELAEALHSGRNRLSRYMLHRAIRRGRVKDIERLLKAMARHDRGFMLRTIASIPFYGFETLRHRIGSRWSRGESQAFAGLQEPRKVLTAT
jgi:glycosyltransferase involved in cell wall biosynthesis